MMNQIALAALALLTLADVFPASCCSPRHDVAVGPWHQCYAHYPQIRECTAPMICKELIDPQHLEDHSAPSVGACTMKCRSSSDCAPMGSSFTCTGRTSKPSADDNYDAAILFCERRDTPPARDP